MKQAKTGMTLLLSMVLLFSGNVFAQKSPFEIGIEGGGSVISLYGNKYLEQLYQPGFGFSSGVSFQYNLNNFLSLRTNLSYERKGNKFSGDYTDDQGNPLGTVTTNFHYDYLTIPLLVRASFGKNIRWFLNAGPYMGYLLTRETVVKGDIVGRDSRRDMQYVRREDYGIALGAGLAIPLKEKFLFSAELRNSRGFYNTNSYSAPNNAVKTNAFSLLVGAAYRLNCSK